MLIKLICIDRDMYEYQYCNRITGLCISVSLYLRYIERGWQSTVVCSLNHNIGKKWSSVQCLMVKIGSAMRKIILISSFDIIYSVIINRQNRAWNILDSKINRKPHSGKDRMKSHTLFNGNFYIHLSLPSFGKKGDNRIKTICNVVRRPHFTQRSTEYCFEFL